jgi:hypothetical protein
MCDWTIRNLETGEVVDLIVDPAGQIEDGNPDWVYAQCGVEDDIRLQGMLDQYRVGDFDGPEHRDVVGIAPTAGTIEAYRAANETEA